MMTLFRTMYRSRATSAMAYAELTALLRVACENNERDGITGLLCYSGGHFLQCLEGPRAVVSRTLARIYRDPRHTDIVLVEACAVETRAFPDWGMKLVPPGVGPGDSFVRLFTVALGDDVAALVDPKRLLDFLTRPDVGTRLQLTRPDRSGTNHG